MRLILGLFGALLALLVLGGGGAFVLSQQEPSIAAGLPPIVASAEAAASFDAKIESLNAAVEEARRTGLAREVELELTEEELTSKAQQTTTIGDGSAVATETKVHLRNGDIVATSKVNIQGFDLRIGVVATLLVENGQTKIVVKEIQTGALPIPDAVKAELNEQIGSAVDPRSLGLPIDVSQLTVADGRIVIKGTARP